jgi:hypothetical protein
VQCKKQITDDAVPPPTPPQRIDVLALIDSLQNTGFFIKNRANPDAPIFRCHLGRTMSFFT